MCPAVTCAPAGCCDQSGYRGLRLLRAASEELCGAFTYIPEPLDCTHRNEGSRVAHFMSFLIVQFIPDEKLPFFVFVIKPLPLPTVGPILNSLWLC